MEDGKMLFQLSSNLQYSKKGDFVETATLELIAPGMPVFDEASDLSQMVMNAMMDAAKNAPTNDQPEVDESKLTEAELEEKREKEKIDGDAVKVFLFSARDIKFKDVAKCFNGIAKKVGTVDGSEPITGKILLDIGIEDYTKLVCEYIANFIVPSLV